MAGKAEALVPLMQWFRVEGTSKSAMGNFSFNFRGSSACVTVTKGEDHCYVFAVGEGYIGGGKVAGIERVLQEGRYWYPVGSAARRLQTSASKVRELMGSGVLEWCQKGKSRTLLVSMDSAEAYRLAAPDPKRKAISKSLRSPDSLKRTSADIPKLSNRSDDEVRTYSVFTPTWDPRST